MADAANDLEVKSRHQRALDRFKLSSTAEDEQRKREVDDLRFVDFDDQWTNDAKLARQGVPASGNLAEVAASPSLTINKLLQPCEIVANTCRQARLALQFAPKTSGADEDTAEAFEDIVRAIQANSRAHLARQWAFERASKCGRGFYRILTEYANDGDNDLDIVYKRILNQSSVYLDPTAQEPDWSDGRWAFVTEDMPLERYKAEFGDSALGKADSHELEGYGDNQPEWVKTTDQGVLIRVAEYFEVVVDKVEVTLYQLPDGTEQNFRADEEIPTDAQPIMDASRPGEPIKRKISKRRVQWSKINGFETLESSEWPGRFIPIIPVIGREANVNGERRWTGLVRPSMDAQRYYNVMVSNQAEQISTSARSPWIAYMETIEPYIKWWNQSATRRFPFLPLHAARDGAGRLLPPPQRNTFEAPIQATTMAIAQANNDIQATTTVHDPSLGNLSPQERSGKAILALQKQSEQSTGVYIDNLAQMSLLYEGKVVRDLIPKIYTRRGRVVPAIGADEQTRQIMLNQPFVSQKGQPVPAQEGQPNAKIIDLSKGEYSVAVTVGKSYTTRREEGVAQMGALSEAAPDLVPSYADIWVENMDFPGARQIADRLKKALPPQLQDGGEDGEPSPQALQQQLQQAAEAMKIQTMRIQELEEVIKTDQVKAQQSLQETTLKAQADVAKEAARLESEQELARLEADVKVKIAEIQANTQFGVAELKAGLDSAKMRLAHIETLMGHTAEAAQIESEQAHDAEQMERNRQAEAQGAEADRQLQAREGDADRGLKRVEGVESRELQREEGEESRAFEAAENERARKAEAQQPEAGA